ncbi:autotransporter outer membrane beta-barrel domain-containing protein [Synechococcus sp. UW105]|uniref:autotransporter outer membrane beta-barrel domain-containing protein n=1 Tax=Synechococcus sp. UW105 TaxID=337067 RepID=UPI001A7E1889|nr:autotransporter outer membrane beta-barrel domain-containing protein [Synechococcus sp. UW105]
MGGTGGSGGSASNVNFYADGTFITQGDASYGVLLQSIGGGGGQGGSVTSNVAAGTGNKTANSSFTLGAAIGKGASGGGGGNAGSVNGSIAGAIATTGAGSVGFFAQSVGGGGGAGGSITNSASAEGEAKFAASATFGMGGSGGKGGNAGSVSFQVPQKLTITTGGTTAANASTSIGRIGAGGAGAGAHGLLLQSIGGGGGKGGSIIGANSATTTSNSSFSMGGSASKGGEGGGGGSAGSVSLGLSSQIAELAIQTKGDNAHAVFLQSIGGGGGAGGLVNNASSGGNLNASFSMGGTGGSGGSASNVNFYADGTFITQGDASYGVLLQSIGGGGGQGGSVTSNASASAKSANASFTMGATVPIGAAGGGGSWGQTVQGSISGAIQTSGDNSIGYFAQSIGGGGGVGGSVTGTAKGSGNAKMQASTAVSMGGAGGSGGSGGRVNINVPKTLTIVTGNASTGTGAGAHGLLLQSIGGGGGQSGSVLSSKTSSGNSQTSFQMGASGGLTKAGGDGGRASAVTLGRSSQLADLAIQTGGDGAHALFLQSVGGGGGAAGSINTGAAGGNVSASMAMGGAGGTGGGAGAVNLFADGTFITKGDGAYGVLLQSIGGGGGQGGSITANASPSATDVNSNFSFGADGTKAGDGGAGGQADDITARLSGNIVTTGTQSTGVFLQSVGGGGGAGGSITNTATNSGNATYSASATFAMGGKGGGGSTAGDVSLTTNRAKALRVSTTGESAKGILLQSIGGGGGQGGSIHNKAANSTTKAELGGFAAGVSGAGGGGGNSGSVRLNANDLIITTTGNNAIALMAQSIGGGGGSAGSNVNNVQGGDVSVNVGIGASGGDGGNSGAVSINIQDGTILTSGDNATALYIQSVGGGGGSSSSFVGGTSSSKISLNGTIGGSGGSGGNSGSVSITNAADIQTTGANAIAIYAQSVGGGGGEASLATPSSAEGNTISGTLQVGGTAGGGGSAGNVSVTNNGIVITKGSQSHGVFSQSVGGGGGRISIATPSASAGTDASISFGGSGGDGGNASNVSVTNSGVIDVSGNAAYGIYAQSVGGGGGSLSSTAAMSASLGGSGGSGGNSGNITITNNAGADIVTRGDNGIGVFALAIGGGGGDIGSSQDSLSLGASGGKGGSAGNVTLTNAGNITTYGTGSYGVVAKSIGGGGGRATANINQGTLSLGGSGGSGGGSGTVTLRNSGDILTFGSSSIPVYLHSVAGGGGDVQSGFGNATLGSNGATGRSGKTELFNTGTLQSNSEFSPAILYQAIGGGGGSADSAKGTVQIGSSNAAGLQSAQAMGLRNEGSLITLARYSPAIFAQSIGGGGGRIAQTSGGSVTIGSIDAAASADLSGGDIRINNLGKILSTKGDYSQALSAQSIGGGGGWVGPVEGNLILGAQNSAAPMDGGDITVMNRSVITTTGNTSPGISLQSIGGGGAYTGQVDGSAQFGSISSSGSHNAGKVYLINSGSVQTSGNFSPLINVQSIGGGGGRAGDIGTSLNLGAVNLIGASANGGDVTVRNSAKLLISKGLSSPALLAQSIGGGGGASAEVTGNVTMGASGTGSANAGAVNVTSSSLIQTTGNNSIGLLAQSIGGGGGVAGLSVGDAVILGGSLVGNASGGTVNVTSTGDITTTGINAAALLAQSIGGGGGAAAKSLGTLSRLGASAGNIANAENVTVTNRGILQTAGNGSPALMVQSIAGGGGYIAETNALARYSVTLAGSNLTSANAGDVKLTNTGRSLVTVGAYSPALVAQSIGGGGGWSLLRSTPNAQLGSEAGTSLKGGNVTLTSTSTIGTAANFSTAAVIQSVGGGGGVTGNALGNVTLGASKVRGNLSAGSINAKLTGNAITEGQNSAALVVQSVAGGGGFGAEVKGNAVLGMTSTASSAADAGSVTFLGSGELVVTKGIDAPAIVLQTIGGGGGWIGNVGGNATLGATQIGSANAGSIQASINYKSIQTIGENSTGILAQAIAGGGGFTGSTKGSVLNLGGTIAGNSTSNAGDVTLTNNAIIITSAGTDNISGINSAAIIAQSIGGGGGASATSKGDAIRLGGISTATESGSLPTITTGNVEITNKGILSTSSVGSAGLIAQSIAGGGGYISQTGDYEEYSVSFGSNGAINAKAGNVNVNNTGAQIATSANFSPALVAQSIGGGGGFSLLTASGNGTTQLGSLNNSGSASSGDVQVTARSILYTQGDYASALTAQSIGGGGGYTGSALGDANFGAKQVSGNLSAGNVVANLTGNVVTEGKNSSAMVIQSIAGGGGFGAEVIGNATLGMTSSGPGTANAGSITFTGSGKAVATEGNDSPALVMQTIGGGGGWIGNVGGNTTLGATQIGSSNAGSIEANINYTTIQTKGDNSTGILAQAIAGGGGFTGTQTGNIATMGGTIASNSTSIAGDVKVTNKATIATFGVNSAAIIAQSIGGGGGSSATSASSTVRMGSISTAAESADIPVITTGNVTVSNTSNLSTTKVGSAGLLAQSLAGGGGYLAQTGSDKKYKITFGSSGELNATAGAVTVNNSSKAITTKGNYSPALVAQSIGGGGGYSLLNASGLGETRIGAINNNSGSANSGNVTVENKAILWTTGAFSAALTAQTIGGGGGVISSAAGDLALGTKNHLAAAASGDIKVTNTNLVQTDGNYSSGIIIQSIGAGGGYIAGSSGGKATLGAVNGLSDTLGTAGSITLSSTGQSIQTSGIGSTAILAQSIGGGGGFIGSSKDGVTFGGTNLKNINAGNVNVTNTSLLSTTGGASAALVVQSIGGGGGVVSLTSNETIQLGGDNIIDSIAGNINIKNSGNISTTGVTSPLIMAQSIGGGGGYATLNNEIAKADNTQTLQMGDNGSLRARSGSITLTNSGNLSSKGISSSAMVVQSIGAGGGNVRRLDQKELASNLQLGASTTGNGSGGDITVSNTGNFITTEGDYARGILIQSIGGGGGWLAGSTAEDTTVQVGSLSPYGTVKGGNIDVINRANITTTGLSAGAITVQSIGGGGGLIGNKVGTLQLGIAKGSGQSDSGSVDVTNSGSISTKGVDAPALLLQSIAGGGGRADQYYGNVQVGLTGRNGTLSATSGLVKLINTGKSIYTEGNSSPGIAAQSIGGGGGFIGENRFTGTPPSSWKGHMGSGAYQWDKQGSVVPDVYGDMDNAGNIEITNTASITTKGEISPALVAQSIGGGGGYAGSMNAAKISLGANGFISSDAGNVVVNNSGDISTTGAGSGGILAQSIAGGGGFLSARIISQMFLGSLYTASSTSGKVTVTNSGNISTTGRGSIGLLAQSVGGGGGVNAYAQLKGDLLTDTEGSYRLFLSGHKAFNSGSEDITVKNTGDFITTTGRGAPALLIQSVGGGGGWTDLQSASNSNLRLGSQDGSVGFGGNIDVNNTANLSTTGNYSQAIRVQTVGGGGGAVSAKANSVRMGAKDMAGNSSGGVITFSNSGNISTTGDGSTGINIMSLGGGGGTIFGTSTALANMGMSAQNLTVDASGGNVTVENTGSFITTSGEAATAITAVSGGGGGGFIAEIGGDLLVGANTKGNTTAGNVSVTNTAVLNTLGDGSIGLAAVSHGGGQALTGPVTKGENLISVGNVGGSDGSGGAVTVNNTGVITTTGAAAPAILVQSAGGGGIYAPVASDPKFFWLGNASTNTEGNAGSTITINTKGDITTKGIGSQALIAQSIGGGGGFLGDITPAKGGLSAALLGSQGPQGIDKKKTAIDWYEDWEKIINEEAAGDSNYFKSLGKLDRVDAMIVKNKTVGIGGGGNANAVNITINAEQYYTQGDNSSVVLAQSIGDGGGWLLLDQGNNYSFLGSIQANGGKGGAITINSKVNLFSLGINSPALVAQSIGGGGGATGDSHKFARIGTLQGRGDTSAGDVTIKQTGNVSTKGIYSSGLLAQSIGGGGGLVGIVSGAVSVGSIQSRASQTSSAGKVNVSTDGTIQTTGNNSPALVAQSIGGGGGWIGQADGQVDIGSFGTLASNNQGNSVAVSTNGAIQTFGSNSTGILAQSIGGGGGFLGINTANDYRMLLGATNSTGSNNSADISVDNKGAITTTGNNSAALIAQSIGGGGGSGAINWEKSDNRNGNESTPLFLLGGINGRSANSGNITVNNQSNLTTTGLGSPALLMQSIAGGGGSIQSLNDAYAGLIQFGYDSGTSSNTQASAGSINFNSKGGSVISTSGERSAAAILQSIGGGGGWGLVTSRTQSMLGSGFTFGKYFTDTKNVRFTGIATGGPITSNVSGTLQTSGNNSPAFVVQTIGGGGGFAGNATTNGWLGAYINAASVGITGSSNLPMPIACRFGSCEIQPVEQTVLADIEGDLITQGSTSPVMLVQAIGGGGGRLGTVGGNATLGLDSLGVSKGDGGAIRVVSNAGASLTSLGNDSAALVIQSIGGGGGSVNSIGGNATLGGSGTGSFRAGAITLNGPFTALTKGINSPGVVMQSIGGGGGLAANVDGDQINFGTVSTGNTSAGDVTAISQRWNISTQKLNSPGLILQSIGGGGGVAYTSKSSVSLGGDVVGQTSSGSISLTSKSNSRIQTTGVSSPAVIAQTIGGGGGYVGGDGSGDSAAVELGGSGQMIGNSGSIDLYFSSASNLVTTGVQSQGVIAQSIGGGGGFTSQSGDIMRIGMDGGIANASDVLITQQGTIITTGKHSEGIVAQSIGGGGGSAGASSTSLVMGAANASGNAGNVTLNNTGGTIQTTGDYSIGVVAQSVGAGGGRIGSASGSLTLGANGASGNAGNVTINNTGGTIATRGNYAPSYLMQSVGGGGGMVGLGDSNGSGTVILGGGSSGTAGSGGKLTLIEGGGILQATGQFSPGVIHQSIGGGGGWIGSVPAGTVQLGGLTTGTSTSADLELTLPFEILTTGAASPGAVLQSIAGGGGIVADVGGNVTIGGTQQANVDASAGSLNYTQLSRSITTGGADSPGVVLQSIGGGGGLLGAVDGSVTTGSTSAAGSDVRGGAITATSAAPITTIGISSPGFTIQSIGGSGALIGSAPTSVTAGGSGFGDSRSGAITFTNSGEIKTAGLNSTGVILQSIAGGGLYTTSAGSNAVSLGGSVIGNNDSAAITFTNSGAITTVGSNSAAIVAQSIAGGGGAVFGLENATATSITLGGENASENKASALNLTITGNLTTTGNLSPALLAQSIGGGGGYAPLPSANARAGAINSLNLDGSSVELNLSADVLTTGFGSDGLLVQSIGAGGGVVGSSTSFLTMGASNLANGDAADVTVNSTGTISTTGAQSIGIFAQSIGAGGGRAGTAAGSVTLGANGATGDAGNVSLNLAADGGNGSIITTGAQSPAFVLQSVGGGGGLVFPSTDTSSGDLLLGGGTEGSQGSGGVISFTAGGNSAITTIGAGSSGLSYQSIGGGGGYTGSTSANAQLGGRYLGTSSAADLSLSSQINAATNGTDAAALMLQSIGGGGGRVGDVGGNANLGGTSGLLGTPEGTGGSLNLTIDSNLISSGDRGAGAIVQAIGGGGGVAGAIGGNAILGGQGLGNRSAGALTLTINNKVGSAGSHAPGLIAQTVGGGGGSVDTVAGNLSLGRTSSVANTGNTSAAAIELTINSGAQLFSTGSTSPALMAQTIGGGGGFAASTTGTVQLGSGGSGTLNANASAGGITWSNAAGGVVTENTATGVKATEVPGISTSGNFSPAVVLQSIGGGGGYTTGGSSVSFSAADHGGSSTTAGDIRVTNSGVITTSGDNSFGMLIQSIGGGGGVGGSSSGVVSLNNTNKDSSSGNIWLTNTGTIRTSGKGSHAVVAQSLAGGGGFVFGGVNKASAHKALSTPSGTSGNLTYNNSGTISATGENAVALLFQTATGGAYLYQNPDGTVSNITEGSTDTVQYTDEFTYDERQYFGARAGEVKVINTGVIISSGEGGIGITKSTSAISGNLNVVNEAGAVIQGGTGSDAAAIVLPTNTVERVTNYGTIIGGSDGSGEAIRGPGGPDEIKNYGEISGDIIIPGLTKNIYNAPDARLESNLVLANGNVTLYQRGVVNPGGEYRIGDLKVYANYGTTHTSLYEADLVLRSGKTDNLTTHYRADLNGTVELLANQVGQAMPGSFVSEGIINAQEGITIGDLKLIAPKSAVASFDFELTNNNTDLAFHYDVDYAPGGLDPNSTAVGKAVNTIQAAGSTADFNAIAALIFAKETKGELNKLYRQLSGATSAAFPQVALATGQAFQQEVNTSLDSAVLSQLQRCILNVQTLQPGDTYTGDPSDCGKWRTWVEAGGSDASTPGSGSSAKAGYNTSAFKTSVGADTLVGDNTLIGIAGRFDNLWTTTDEPTTFGKTEGWSGMLYAKQRLSSSTWLTGSFSAGGFATDTTRQVNIQGYPSTEEGSSSSTAIGGSLRLSHLISTGNQGSLTPSLGLSWLQLNQASYSESTTTNNRAYIQPGNPLIKTDDPGKASYSLKYDAATYNSVPLELAIAFKQPFKTGSTTFIPRISLGYAWDLGDTNRALTASFRSAPKGSFTVDGTPAPTSWFNVGLGLDVALNNRFSLYFNGLGQISPASTQSINYNGGFRWSF